MEYKNLYQSPLGPIELTCDECGLTGIWLNGQKEREQTLTEAERPVFAETRRWLDLYFQGDTPDFMPPLHPKGTPFQQAVWAILQTIPYGQTMSYGEIAARIAAERGIEKMSAQAVGQAVGSNPLSILVPCHRVVGKNGNLTGYSGGMDYKIYFLKLEGVDLSQFFRPGKVPVL